MEKLQIEQCKKCPHVRKSLLDKILGRIPVNTDCGGAVSIIDAGGSTIDRTTPFMFVKTTKHCSYEVSPALIEQSNDIQQEIDQQFENASIIANERFESLSEEDKEKEREFARRLVHDDF